MGEHNERILGDLLGMSADAISDLADDGVTGTAPAF